MPNRVVSQDTEIYYSEPASLKLENTGGGTKENARFEVMLADPMDLTQYDKITFWFRPSVELEPQALKVLLHKDTSTSVGSHLDPVSPNTLPANTWSKVVFDISEIEERDNIEQIRIFFSRDEAAPESYDFHIDDLALEK